MRMEGIRATKYLQVFSSTAYVWPLVLKPSQNTKGCFMDLFSSIAEIGL